MQSKRIISRKKVVLFNSFIWAFFFRWPKQKKGLFFSLLKALISAKVSKKKSLQKSSLKEPLFQDMQTS